ncbi:MAG: hypothetical protein LUG85_06245 [Clostridiales bacterium]|nr:hypothetical protein [Clostridiales bacterium]
MEEKKDKRICLLDLNYTLVSNQQDTKYLRPFEKRLAAEEYRQDLIDTIRTDYVIIITARPDHQQNQTLQNLLKKTGWQPDEAYFNDIDAAPPEFKESALKRFVFPKHGEDGSLYYAVESNPKTRAMYAKYEISAQPYDVFIKQFDK